MRDPCRCLQAFILKALNMQWGHIYLEVAAAQDNNIPLHLGVIKCGWDRLDVPQHTSDVTTQYWLKKETFVNLLAHHVQVFRTVWGTWRTRRDATGQNRTTTYNLRWKTTEASTLKKPEGSRTGCHWGARRVETGSNTHQPAGQSSTGTSLATPTCLVS